MMFTTFDTNEILYKMLNVDAVRSMINGKVYNDGRPFNSDKEDVVVNTINVTQRYKPQLATSNINIHVPDLPNGLKNSGRLSVITKEVVNALKAKELSGYSIYLSNQTTIENPPKSHFVNLRIEWRIYDDKFD